MVRGRWYLGALVFSLAITTIFFPAAPAQALDLLPEKGLTLSPLRTELSIDPGATITGTVNIVNKTVENITVNLTAESFQVVNEQYDYAFSEESDETKWIQFNEDSVELSPGATKTVSYQVAVPLQAEPGGRYVSLFAGADTQSSQSSVPSRQRVASLLYITVQGPVTRKGEFLGLSVPLLTSKDPYWSTRLRNTGTTHYRSRYEVAVKGVDGRIISEQKGDALILPGTVRLVSDTLQMPDLPGLYQLDYLIGLGDNPAFKDHRWILYSPPYVTGAAVVTGVLGTGLLINGLRRRKV